MVFLDVVDRHQSADLLAVDKILIREILAGPDGNAALLSSLSSLQLPPETSSSCSGSSYSFSKYFSLLSAMMILFFTVTGKN